MQARKELAGSLGRISREQASRMRHSARGMGDSETGGVGEGGEDGLGDGGTGGVGDFCFLGSFTPLGM